MKQQHFLLIITLTLEISFSSISFSQWSYLGLGGRIVEDLHAYNSFLYAGTDSGVFRKTIGSTDTVWASLGLETKQTLALLVFNDSTYLASVVIAGISYGDTISLFKTTNAGISWFPFQNFYSGNGPYSPSDFAMSYSQPDVIYAVRGAVAKSTDGGMSWQRIRGNLWNSANFEFIEIDTARPNIIWTGGTDMIFVPFLDKSTDFGESWQNMPLGLSGDQRCFSVALDPADSNIVYAGLWNVVIKTIDGGATWSAAFVPVEQQAFYGLVLSRDSFLYAAGARDPIQRLLFYESTNGGATWDTVNSGLFGYMSVKNLLVIPNGNIDNIFLGTFGGGVFSYTNIITSVHGVMEPSVPERFSLQQNFPNPFNPTTRITFSVGTYGHTSLRVYDILGREVATLVNGMKETGTYTVTWNAKNTSSGIYFYVLHSKQAMITKKMILLR